MVEIEQLIERLRAGDVVKEITHPSLTYLDPDGVAHESGPLISRIVREPFPLACEAVTALAALKARNTELEARLEVVPGWSESTDGIACRDDTIKQLDANVAALKARCERLEGALGQIAAPSPYVESYGDQKPLRCQSCAYRGHVTGEERHSETCAYVIARAALAGETPHD